MNAIETVNRWLTRAEAVLSGFASAMLLAIMLVVVADVGFRYFMHAPLTWSYDLISLYLMVGVFFFSLSDTLNHDEHVCVDILHKYVPEKLRRFNEAVGYLLGAGVFAAIFWMGLLRTVAAYHGNEVSPGAIAWPMWLSSAAVPLGAGLMLLRMLFRAWGHAMSLWSGRPLIELPRIVDSEEAA